METMRLNYTKIAPEIHRSLGGIETYVHSSNLEPRLLHLVKLRASQINGCGWCIDMHTKDSIAEGEDIQKLFLVSAWRESPQFSEREKIALEWCETITKISQCDPDDELYNRVLKEFGEDETVALTGAIIAINAWNRLNVAFRAIPGTYERKDERAKSES